MDKTIKQIADELGIDKQKVYRFIKNNCINEVHHEALHEAHQNTSIKYYDDAAQTTIKQHFKKKSTSNEAHHEAHHEAHQSTSNDAVIEVLKQQLIAKDKQIEELHKLIDQQQQLSMADHQRIVELEQKQQESEPTEQPIEEAAGEKKEKKRWWNRIL